MMNASPPMRRAWSPAVFVCIGGAMVTAGGVIAAINSAVPFSHGSWLAAYLVLVAGVAQIVLGVLGSVLGAARLEHAQLLLWNLGSLAVPAGVLVTEPVLVALGSIALLVGLAAFAIDVRGAAPSAMRASYRLFILALAISVLVGCTLGDAAPAGWVL